MAQFTVFTRSKFRPDMHQAFMAHGHYTKYESHSAFHVSDFIKIYSSAHYIDTVLLFRLSRKWPFVIVIDHDVIISSSESLISQLEHVGNGKSHRIVEISKQVSILISLHIFIDAVL